MKYFYWLLIGLSLGCGTVQRHPHWAVDPKTNFAPGATRYVIHDRCYGDYWTGDGWTENYGQALPMSKQSADSLWSDFYTEKLTCEYAGGGPLSKYPLVVEVYQKPIRWVNRHGAWELAP